ncbi:MAG: hypothetical protein FNT29_02680 [Halothiobacillaceae bacterium]|nr:MAG: hypothetical protein FNT29_02680 [Halothiobacillaceae bacterium]
MAVTASGIGSGLDIQGIVSQLVQAEQQPKSDALNRQQSAITSRLSALGTLKGALSSFQSSVAALGNLSTFSTHAATSSNSIALSVAAGSSASAGSYTIDVQQLASAQKLISSGFASADTTVGTGTLTLSVGGASFDVTIDSSNSTLAGIRDAINKAGDNTGVSATIVNVDDGVGGTESRLVLSASKTGAANTITVSASGGDGGLNALASANLTEQVAAKDAIIKVDGMNITRSSNTMSDAIDGLTLTLGGVATGVQVGVSTDTSQVKAALQGFVDSYNKMQGVMSGLGKYDPSTKQAGALVGDALLRNVQQQLRADLGSPVSSVSSSTVDTLMSVGVQFDRYGAMSLDSTKLSSVMGDNLNPLVDLFQSSDGIATRTRSDLDLYLQSGGIIDSQTSSLNDQKRRIDDQRLNLTNRMNALQTQLLKQFNAMDAVVSQYNSTGSYLTQVLAGLSAINKQ